MDETKRIYYGYPDRMWEKRYHSKFLIRRYIHRTQYETIIKYVKFFKPKLILDYGCGEGVLSTLLAERDFNLIGVDISKPNIKVAKKHSLQKHLNIKYVIGDVENLPFKDNSFELVVSSHVLEHLNEIEKGLCEIKKISEKAIIAVPTCLSLSSLSMLGGDVPWKITKKTPFAVFSGLLKLTKNFNKNGVIEKYSSKEFPHVWFYPWKFKRILENNGFNVIKIEASSLCLPYISYFYPNTIKIFKFMDRFKDKKPLNIFGYGTTYIVEVR
ncbi:MAG: methyltransferase domain-containing protein [Candidatus Aenigmarchaeota archaeon]|nr:methyltransferase domain-containing protein [Candidatus Aenigmarchaeota archaeon]